jgi:predicted small lipoprotein YifL
MHSATRHYWLLSTVCCLIVGLLACGRKAPLHPPEDVLPKAITDLSASNTTEGIQLSWSRPRTYADGSPMTDLGGFIVERAVAGDPRAAFERVASLEVSDRDRFRQVKRFRHDDNATSVGTAYRYQVVSFTLDRYFSAPSNVVMVERTITGEESHAPLPTPQR